MKITNLITETQVQKVILQLQNANGLSIDGIYEPNTCHCLLRLMSRGYGTRAKTVGRKMGAKEGKEKKQQRKTKRKQKSQKSINSRIGRE